MEEALVPLERRVVLSRAASPRLSTRAGTVSTRRLGTASTALRPFTSSTVVSRCTSGGTVSLVRSLRGLRRSVGPGTFPAPETGFLQLHHDIGFGDQMTAKKQQESVERLYYRSLEKVARKRVDTELEERRLAKAMTQRGTKPMVCEAEDALVTRLTAPPPSRRSRAGQDDEAPSCAGRKKLLARLYDVPVSRKKRMERRMEYEEAHLSARRNPHLRRTVRLMRRRLRAEDLAAQNTERDLYMWGSGISGAAPPPARGGGGKAAAKQPPPPPARPPPGAPGLVLGSGAAGGLAGAIFGANADAVGVFDAQRSESDVPGSDVTSETESASTVDVGYESITALVRAARTQEAATLLLDDEERLDDFTRDIFNEADADESGTLDVDELRAILRAFYTAARIEADEDHLEDICREVDDDGSGTIEIDEFLVEVKTFLSTLRISLPHDREPGRALLRQFTSPQDLLASDIRLRSLAAELFEMADQDGSGDISGHEFKKVVRVFEKHFDFKESSRNEIRDAFSRIDRDESGELNQTEFLSLLQVWLRQKAGLESDGESGSETASTGSNGSRTPTSSDYATSESDDE